MKHRRPFSDTNVANATTLRLTPAVDGRTIRCTVEGEGHVLRRVDLVRLHEWLSSVLERDAPKAT